MFVKKVVLMVIILIGITGHADTTNAGSLVCDVSTSEVAQVFTSDILAKLPVPKLHFDCVSTDPTGQGAAQITTNLFVANQPTDPPLLIEGATVYQGQVSGNVTTFPNIQIFQGPTSFDITNIQLNGTIGTPFTPIYASGTVYKDNATATYPAVTVGIIGQGGNGGTAIFGTDHNLYIPYANAFGNTYRTRFSLGQPATGRNYFVLNDVKLTSPSTWNNYASFSPWTKGRYLGFVPDLRSYINNNSYAAGLVYDPIDQPFAGQFSFEVTHLWLNFPFSSKNARQIAAGALLSVPDEALTYASLFSFKNTIFGVTPVGGPPVRYLSTIGGSFDVQCVKPPDGDTQCTSTFNNFMTPYVSLNGNFESTAKSFNPPPQNWTTNLYDFRVKTLLADITYNMNIAAQDTSVSSTVTNHDLLVNGIGKGTYTIQGNPIPYEFWKSDFHALMIDDKSTNSFTFNALSGRTYNSCSGLLLSPRTTTGLTFSVDYSKILGGSLQLTNAYSSDSIDAIINGDGGFSINFNSTSASAAGNKSELDAACLPIPSGAVPKLSVSPMSLFLDHKIGVTQCPTPIGDINIANIGDPGSTLLYSITTIYGSAGSGWLNFSFTNGSVAAGSTAQAPLQFNCNVAGPNNYTATATITGTDSAGNVVGTVNVPIAISVTF